MQRRDSNAASISSRGRRMSKFVPGGARGSEDASGGGGARPPTRRLENTYRTEPEEGAEFSASAVQRVCRGILSSTLDGVRSYDPAESARLVLRLTANIKQAVKEMHYQRYKLVVNVMLAENRRQGFEAASRAVWNDRLDNYACTEYKSDVLCALVLVHGIYYE